ncbi:MAG: SGNH/GDSL hydrolase family protein, partial [Butyrivibrio sp.]|nr:SGNH/GDSL hydrolase family protein [Butyrivibrio sp.]
EDYDEDYDDEPGRRKRIDLANLPWWVHAAILGTIALIIGASAWALYRWNTGEKITFTKTDDMSQYETERLDNVFYLTSEDLEGHVDDGVNTILCLGNDAFTYNSGDKGLASRIAALTDSTVYNAAFPLSCVSLRTATYDSSYPMDLFSFYNVTQAMVSGDFSDMEAAAAAMDDSTYSQSVDVLQNIDMDSVDMIVIMYDAQDYLNQRAGRDFNDADNPITFMGAYHAGLTALREAFPYIRIVVMSHTLCYAYTSEGVVSGDTYDFGNGALPTYLQHIIDTCEELGVTFVDNYYGTVDESNSSELLVDTIHLSDDCVELIAEHFKELLFGE